jgi:hypothetical protein
MFVSGTHLDTSADTCQHAVLDAQLREQAASQNNGLTLDDKETKTEDLIRCITCDKLNEK